MDEEISKWILEYSLRQPIDEKIERIIHGVLPTFSLKDGDNRLKKTLLLHRIEFEVSNAVISEKLLDLLELMEQIDDREGNSCSDSMKSAYCAVAVDCTVRFLDQDCEFNANNPKYIAAVNRVWKSRVCKVEGLFSQELSQKMEEIVAALWDSEVCAKLLRLNTGNLALKRIRVYVEEERKNLGPSFLEWMAIKVGKEWEGLRNGGAYGESLKGRVPLEQNHITVSKKRRKSVRSLFVDEETDAFKEKAVKIPAPEVDRVTDLIKSSEQQAFKKGCAPVEQKRITVKSKRGEGSKILRVDEEADVISEKAVKIPIPEVHTGSVAMESSPLEMYRQVSKKELAPVEQKCIKMESKHGKGAKIMYADEETDVSTENAVKIPAPEVYRALIANGSGLMGMERQVSKKGRASVEQKRVKMESKHDEGAKIMYLDEETDVCTEEDVKIPAPEVDRVPLANESSLMEMERHVSKKGRAPVEQKRVKMESKHDEGAKIMYVDEETDVITEKPVKIPPPEVDRGLVAIKSSLMKMVRQVSKKGRAPVEQKRVKLESKHDEGAKIMHVDEETDVSTEKAVKIPAREVDRGLVAIESSPMEMYWQVSKKGRALVEQKKRIKMESKHDEGSKVMHLDEETDVNTEKAVKIPAREVDRGPVAVKSSLTEMERQVSKKSRSSVGQKHITVKSECRVDAKILDVDEVMDVITKKAVKIPAPEVDRVPAAIESGPMEVEWRAPSKKVDLPNARIAQTLPSVMANSINYDTLVENEPRPKMDAAAEVERVREEIKSGSTELHAAVRDCLPDALQTEIGAEIHASPRAYTGGTRKRPTLYRPSPITVRRKRGTGAKISVVDEEEDMRMQESLKTPPPEADRVPASTEKVDLPNALAAQTSPIVMETPVDNHCTINKSDVLLTDDGTHAPSPETYIDKIDVENLETRQNPTQHGKPDTNDATDYDILGGSSPKSPRLPSPKVNIPPSSSKSYNNRNTVITKRRTSKKWKPEEEEALRKGVRKYGEGNWKMIRRAYDHVFHVEGRTEVDLKDKWRNLMKDKRRKLTNENR